MVFTGVISQASLLQSPRLVVDLEKNPNKEKSFGFFLVFFFSFPIPERQFPEFSFLPSAFLTGNVSHIHVCVFSVVTIANSRQWWNCCLGEPGWDSETPAAVPQRRALTAVPVLPGEWPLAPWAAGSTPLVSAGKGKHPKIGLVPEPTALRVLAGVPLWSISEQSRWGGLFCLMLAAAAF